MKTQYRIIFALCVTALFAAGLAFGAMNLTNTTDVNESNENETNATEIAVESGNASVMPVNTTVEPATVLETTVVPSTPASTAKPSPGLGIIMAIAVVLSAIYIHGKRR
jgi:hypothetical protein